MFSDTAHLLISYSTKTTPVNVRNMLLQLHLCSPMGHSGSRLTAQWQELNADTIALAKSYNKPIYLSSGFSACHWWLHTARPWSRGLWLILRCHVFAKESFANADTARIMNDHFVNVILDREEQPDIDKIYMTYLQVTRRIRSKWYNPS
jgi:hypothetical protein